MSTFDEHIGAQLTKMNEIFNSGIANPKVSAALARSLHIIVAMERITASVNTRPEHLVYIQALREVQHSMLSVCIGSYRQAYASLRLFFELSLCAVEFSVDQRYFRSWQLGNDDISWSRLSDLDTGVLSKSFTKLFFPELDEHVVEFRVMALSVYRECSEYVHGNPNTTATLPLVLSLKEGVVLDWANKLDTIALIVTFTFVSRYLRDMPNEPRESIKEYVLDQLGYLGPIRGLLGGTVGG
jgi:hypothetical protein